MSGDPTEAWPDGLDEETLAGLRRLHTQLDSPPSDMAEQMLLSMAVADLDAELASLREDQLVGSGARAAERTRSISFETASLTIMVTTAEVDDGRVRLDGWLAPSAPLRVELRMPQAAGRSSQTTTADETGRFVFSGLPIGKPPKIDAPTGDRVQSGKWISPGCAHSQCNQWLRRNVPDLSGHNDRVGALGARFFYNQAGRAGRVQWLVCFAANPLPPRSQRGPQRTPRQQEAWAPIVTHRKITKEFGRDPALSPFLCGLCALCVRFPCIGTALRGSKRNGLSSRY